LDAAAAADEKSPHDEVLLKLKLIYGSISSIYAVSSEVANLSASQHLVLHFHFTVHEKKSTDILLYEEISTMPILREKNVLLKAGKEVQLK
jgi:hypothetical protein